MQNAHSNLMDLTIVLEKEISILGSLRACQKRMFESVAMRNWLAFQDEHALSSTLSAEFVETDQARIELSRRIDPAADGSRDFYHITAKAPLDERARLNALFREVKCSLMLSKAENDSFQTYVANARAFVEGLMETVNPARRNKIYTRRGALASAPVESVVLNRSF